MDDDIIGGLIASIIVGVFTWIITYAIMDNKRDRLVHLLGHMPTEIVEQANKIVHSEEKHAEDFEFAKE